MKQTPVSLPEDLLALVQRIAVERGVSLGDVVRDALRAYLCDSEAQYFPRSIGFANSHSAVRGRDLC